VEVSLVSRSLRFRSCVAVISVLGAVAAGAADAPPAPADPYAALAYRFIGPPGNRVSAVAGVPGDPNTYYVERLRRV
jgi:hypothetical protein